MQALDWTLDSLLEDGDEFVVVRGFELGDLREWRMCYLLFFDFA